ncbi:Protein of uncharacterised function (DUF3108) [Porphyromonas crevioricanis]|uniref:Protein of uncharacterized function (DUF3108) n=2 Tax=Porphyromonas crevioricanis TaxID=393921 RepID=A0A2X4PM50_9PORP|nr:DUF3108 domain-containing protein [Porphyromonas crevioricanis]SQH73435.1 Protein of uncharacterised function (DUF3108) [Porphyromonas crevioricanis]
MKLYDVFFRICLWTLFPGVSICLSAEAQPNRSPKALMHPDEILKYNVEFQWGLISPNAGSAEMRMREVQDRGRTLYAYKISLRTSSFFDNIYYLRDQVESFYLPDLTFVRSIKDLVEREKPSTRRMTVHFGAGNKARGYRYYQNRRDWVMYDTIVPLDSKYPVVDLFGSVIYLRSVDYSQLSEGQRFSITVIDNADVIQATITYKGKEKLKVSRKKKYKTLRFVIDIHSDKFEQQKESMEVWISDDDNRIPIQMKSQLKIGAGVAVLKSTSGLKYPFRAAE